MSQENVEIVRRAFAGFGERGIEGALAFNAFDVVTYSIPEWPDDPVYYGHEGVRKLARQWAESFDGFGFELRELRNAGDSVVALFDIVGTIKGSGDPINQRLGFVGSQFRAGTVGEVRCFSSWKAALEAAGLTA